MGYCNAWIFHGDIEIKLSTINIKFPYQCPLISKFEWKMNMSIRTFMDTLTGILDIHIRYSGYIHIYIR